MPTQSTWRTELERSCSKLVVGGFRPSNTLLASTFGEIRATDGQHWPELNGDPLWPVCQLNLRDAPFRPDNLRNISLLQVFVADAFWQHEANLIDTREAPIGCPFYIRAYPETGSLTRVDSPATASTFRPFEAAWDPNTLADYPTHDCLPFDFEALGLGDYYDQEDIDRVHATKIGGWPSCIQSEPWWDYRQDGADFEFALQIDSEPKANCHWGDQGTVYLARHKTQQHLWAVDWQCL